jgi:hypothetical protein
MEPLLILKLEPFQILKLSYGLAMASKNIDDVTLRTETCKRDADFTGLSDLSSHMSYHLVVLQEFKRQTAFYQSIIPLCPEVCSKAEAHLAVLTKHLVKVSKAIFDFRARIDAVTNSLRSLKIRRECLFSSMDDFLSEDRHFNDSGHFVFSGTTVKYEF